MAGALAALLPVTAAAQERSIINESFESNNPQGPGTPKQQIYANAIVPGWNATSGFIELWDSGFNGVPAYDGLVFAEMNANQPGSLYQPICLVNGETIGWRFAHRARSGGPATQNARFEIATTSGSVLQVLANQASTTANQVWNLNTGSTIYNGVSGLQRVQFTTTDPGSYGNFLDAIQVTLRPFVQMSATTGSGSEVLASSGLPTLKIDGTVRTAFTVTLTVTGGTAIRGTDYTTPGGNATFQVTVPVGVYNNAALATGIQIINDTEVEGAETINLALSIGPAYTISSTDVCGGTANTTASYTILDNDSRVTLRKQWTNAAIGDSTLISLRRGTTLIDSFNSTASAAGQLASDPTPSAVVFGETLTLAEVLGTSNFKKYISAISCTGAADTNLADGLTVGSSETAIACTYTNTGIDPLLVTKSSFVVNDGIHAIGPMVLPGALMRYCILVTNPGVFAATGVIALDQLPPETNFVSGSMRSGASCTNAGLMEDDDALDDGETSPTDIVRANKSGNTITATATTLAAGTSFALTFDTLID